MTSLAILDAALRSDFPTFVEKVFQTVRPDDRFMGNWHVRAMSHALYQTAFGSIKRLAITIPPRSLKSILASIALPAFILGKNPGASIICVSHSSGLATQLARHFRNVLASDWYQRAFPDVQVSKDTDDIVETTRGGARVSASIGASVTGFGAEIIIIDDPLKPNEAPSEAARESVNRYYDQVLYSRLNSKANGSIVLVMQRLHEDDLCGHLLERGQNWVCLSLPAIATTEEVIAIGDGQYHTRRIGDLLHAAREPKWVLDELRNTLGGAGFEAQYQQAPVPATGNMIKTDWLLRYRKPPVGFVTQSWDTASKGNPKNDFSVCTTWVEQAGRHYLIDVYREQVDFPDLMKAVIAQSATHHPQAILIEDHGSGTGLIQQLRTQSGLHPISVLAKLDKPTRLSFVLPMFEAKQVFLPEDAPWLPLLEKELLGFPHAKFDDQVDSISQYLNWIKNSVKPIFESDFGTEESFSHQEIANVLLSQPRFWNPQ